MTVSAHDTDWLARTARSTPDAVALVTDSGDTVTYSQLDGWASLAADREAGAGVAPGDVVPVFVATLDENVIIRLWGIWRLGAAPIVVDATSPDAGRWNREGTSDLQREHSESQSPLHTVILTSGSGGEPRPVRLTRGNVAAAVTAAATHLGNDAGDRWLLAIPLFHIGGLSILWRSAAAGGGVVIHRRFEPARVAAAIRHGAVTVASLVPTMLYRLLEADPGPFRGMRAILLGGAAASRELVERGLEAGLPILQTYGMTETCSQVATVVPGEEIESLGTVGPPLAGIHVETGEAGVGEIVVSGEVVSPGYLGQPDRAGGHHTGDIGYVDENGRLVVLGRVDDMVVTGGENAYPNHIADVLAGHPALGEVEVVGIPDPEWGQALVAIAVGDSGSLRAIEAWALFRLSRHEIPKKWVFVDAMPIGSGGKIDRIALHDIAESAP